MGAPPAGQGRAAAGIDPGTACPRSGPWPGPIYRQLGVLNLDDRTAECHICGRRFRLLAHHVWTAHQVWADEYRAPFDLVAQRGLAGPMTSARLREVAREHLLPHHERAVELARAITPEERSAAMRGRRLRLETLLDPDF